MAVVAYVYVGGHRRSAAMGPADVCYAKLQLLRNLTDRYSMSRKTYHAARVTTVEFLTPRPTVLSYHAKFCPTQESN